MRREEFVVGEAPQEGAAGREGPPYVGGWGAATEEFVVGEEAQEGAAGREGPPYV